MRKFPLYLKVVARRLSNPIFFLLLAISFGLWYITKLSYAYTTEIKIPVRIDSTLYSVRCNVEGVGYQILLHKMTPRKNMIRISSSSVAVSPSGVSPGIYEISSFSLQNAISTKISDLKILSVEDPVEIELPKNQP